MKKENNLKKFYILWSTQSLSQLGSSITTFALTLWLYEKTGSALSTAALTICSYAPYVLMSIFAGALTDRFDKKKTMLICDVLAAMCTITVFVLYKAGMLEIWHLYTLNVISGLMNTVQQPASEVAMTLITPKECYQKTSGLQSLSRSLISVLNPLIATALYSFAGLDFCISVDLTTFVLAYVALFFFIDLPVVEASKSENVLVLAKEGIGFLKENPLVLNLILFLSGINLIASCFDATLPGYVIPNPRGGTAVLGIVTSSAGAAMVVGSFIVTLLPKPKNRVRVIYLTMLFSLATENFVFAFSRNPVWWCVGQVLGWLVVPIMSANLDVVLRYSIPVKLQGRVYACRNTLQFFTIPLGLFLGGYLVDNVCEPFMNIKTHPAIFESWFGSGKGSGAALVMFIIAVAGTLMCLAWGSVLNKYEFKEN